MAETPKTAIDIRDFEGLSVSADPHDITINQATVQLNVTSQNDGRLTTRAGYRIVLFDGE